MNCKTFNKLLHEYLDGGLSSRKQAAAESHILNCEHCQTALNSEMILREKMFERLEKETKNLSLNPDVLRNIRVSINSENSSDPKRSFGFNWLFTPRWQFVGACCVTFLIIDGIAREYFGGIVSVTIIHGGWNLTYGLFPGSWVSRAAAIIAYVPACFFFIKFIQKKLHCYII